MLPLKYLSPHFRKHTLLLDEALVGYALLASPPASYQGVIEGVTVAIEKLAESLVFQKTQAGTCRRGEFRTITFGCSYGGGRKVT